MNPPATPPPDGPCAEYFSNGTVSCTGTYQNGLRTGGWQYFLLHGQVKAAGHCAKGKMTGGWRTWDEAGQLIKTTRHKSS